MCVIDIFNKYSWIALLKDKKGVKVLDKSECKPSKISVDKGSEFYSSSVKKWLKDNYIDMYSIHIVGKSVVAERFIRTLKTKIYKYMTLISKNVYIRLGDIVNQNIHTIEQLR